MRLAVPDALRRLCSLVSVRHASLSWPPGAVSAPRDQVSSVRPGAGCRRAGAQPGTRPDEVRWDSCRTYPILAPGQLAKLWALRDGACALLAPVLRPSAANGVVAACPTAVLAAVRAPRAANGGVAACPKEWARAQSGLGRHPRDLGADLGRADRVRLCREDEDRGGERQRGEGGGQPGTSPGTGLLSRHDHSSFRGGTFARSVSEGPSGMLRIACDTAAERLRWKDPSGTAGRVVWPVGQELLPFLLGEAASGELARPRFPVGGIDVPAPRRSRIRDDDNAAAVGSE